MLSVQRRIPRKLFPILKTSKKLFSNKLFLLKSVSYTGSQTRVCFSISKKLAKRAVDRNRLRRLGYRLVESYIDGIGESLLVQISWKAIPETPLEADQALKSILSNLKSK